MRAARELNSSPESALLDPAVTQKRDSDARDSPTSRREPAPSSVAHSGRHRRIHELTVTIIGGRWK